jgi:hypothetical protein
MTAKGMAYDGRSMRKAAIKSLPALLVALAVIVLVPASAPAAGGNVATTQAYIQANYRLVQASASKIAPIETTLRGIRSRILDECPGSAAGSPQDSDSEQLSNEVIGTMVTGAVSLAELPATRQFVRIAARLRWSDSALTDAVHAYVGKVRGLVALAPPQLCADVRSWATSGFHTLPATTAVFAPRFISVWVAPGDLPPSLARYETAAERTLLRRTRRLEQEFTEMEARAVETWSEIMNGLGLLP